MSRRLSSAQRQHILWEMLELARFLGREGVPLPTVKEAVGQLRDDLVKAYQHAIAIVEVHQADYLTSCREKEENHATR
jgi:hypothetical protein